MPLPGFPGRRNLDDARTATRALATRAAALAGLAPPAPDDDLPRLLDSSATALAVLAEQAGNARQDARRERERLATEQARATKTRAGIAEALSDLRERLRRTGDGGPSLTWAVQHVDAILQLAGAREFVDEGSLTPARHRVVERRAADAAHPPRTIASTVRPGLLLDGEVLRPQEIVAYTQMDGEE
jgi:molecular chaperone GrpE (heat shock protein)